MYYVVVDTGCIECGENTAVLGIFTDKEEAAKIKQGSYFDGGQHCVETFEVPELNLTGRYL